MNKILYTLSAFIVFMIGVAFFTISNESKAFSFNDIKTAITGHIDDAVDRFKDDQFVNGVTTKSSSFTLTKDSIHWAEGNVFIVEKDNKKYVQLGNTFEAGLAPDLYIFTSSKIISSQHDVDVASKDNLQKLVKGSGASFYEVSGDIKSIVIWCQAFNQWMGTAIIK